MFALFEGFSRLKLNKSRRNTIDEFINKLERDHLDMELSYGKLFQELGYTFLTNIPQESFDDADDGEYKDFNDRVTTGLDDTVMPNKADVNESQMDKIKYTLDDLRSRINEMRKKFRQFLAKSKKAHKSSGGGGGRGASAAAEANRSADLSQDIETDEVDDDDDDDETGGMDEEDEDLFKLCVYVVEQKKIVTFKIHKRCRVRELKQILLEKVADPARVRSIDELKLTFNSVELANDAYTISDYSVGDKATVTLEFRVFEDDDDDDVAGGDEE